MNAQRTVLFHPLNHIGLGHINRLAVIALALREIDSSIRTPFVVEEAAHVLLDALRLPYLPLPSSQTMMDGSVWGAWTDHERYALQTEISRSVLRSTTPEVAVFDCLPNPAFAEAVVSSQIPIVLCLREMRNLSSYLDHARDLLRSVRLVVVPHPQGTVCLPDELAAKSCFVGQIVRSGPTAIPNHDPARPRIIISGGGGGYPRTFDFYNLGMKAIVDLRECYPALTAQLIAGPLFSDWSLLHPVDGVTIVPFEPDIASRFSEADLVICQAGYNTVAELEQIGTRTLLVPAERQWDDQFARAERVTREHENFRIFRAGSAGELATVALELLRTQIPKLIVRKPDGAMKAAHLIYKIAR